MKIVKKITCKHWSMEVRMLLKKVFYPIVDQTQQRYCLCLCGDKCRSYMCPVPYYVCSQNFSFQEYISFLGTYVFLLLTFHLPYLVHECIYIQGTFVFKIQNEQDTRYKTQSFIKDMKMIPTMAIF